MVFTHTDTHTVVTTLTNGRKLVMSRVWITNNNTSATQVTISPLLRIINWAVFINQAGNTVRKLACVDGTRENQIQVTPSADATGASLTFLSVGV